MPLEFPDGIRKIIEDVHNQKRAGTLRRISSNADDDAALAVVNNIQDKSIRIEKGLTVATPSKAVEDLHWAAKQYFRILLNDLDKGFKDFRNHEGYRQGG
jgi:hypothetical protein